MPLNWKTLAENSDGEYTVENFKQALHQITTEQVLYERFRPQAVSYRLVARYRNEFKEAADLQGLTVGFRDAYRLCYVLSDTVRPTKMPLDESLFLLVARKAYHVQASVGNQNSDGDVFVDLPEFQELYLASTGRPLDMKLGYLRGLLKTAKSQGLACEGEAPDGSPQPFSVQILPGIAEVLTEHAISRFGAHMAALVVTGQKADQTEVEREQPTATEDQ